MAVNIHYSGDGEENPSYIMEKERLLSFKDWPFREDCVCTPENLSAAGFYHCPTNTEPDLVKCFVCQKELDSWDPEDDPLKEHVSHSKDCPFIKLAKREAEMKLEELLKLVLERNLAILRKDLNGLLCDVESTIEDTDNRMKRKSRK